MATKATEIHIREQTKLVLKYLEQQDLEKARQVIIQHKEILCYNFGLINFVPLIPRIRFSRIIPRTNDALKMVIDTGFEIFLDEDNVNELLFFASAKCDKEKLTDCVAKIGPASINQVREGDTALMFLIKYGNLGHEDCPECMKILIDAGIDVNRNDYFSHNPIVFLANLYDRYTKRALKNDIVIRNLKKCIELLLETKAIDIASVKIEKNKKTAKELLTELNFLDVNYAVEKTTQGDGIDKFFKFLINGDEQSFVKSKEVLAHLDADDGNNTFLQLCCEKNLKVAAKFLIDKGADVSKTTERNPKSPLELAARRNHPEIFEALLATNKIVIDEELFVTFLQNRPKHIKAKYFDEILKYKHLDENVRSTNGNTPLHYAIIFSSSDAIHTLLQRGASLTVENNAKKCPLDYIAVEDLENHLNKCIRPDNYNTIDNGRYEVALNYRNLIESGSELAIIQRICASSKLSRLLNHPLISSFIDLKWKLVQSLYYKIFIFHLLFYIVTIFSFMNLTISSYLQFFLVLMYGARIASTFSWKNNKLHEFFDLAIVSLILVSFLMSNNGNKYHLGVISTIFMAVSFHFFCRFSPNFSQFHAILINIIGHIFLCLSYVFVLTLFLGAAAYIFFSIQYEDDDNYTNPYLNDVKMLLSHFYLLCAFGVFFSVMIVMTVINSVAYLQGNAKNMRDDFQVTGYKNVLIFLNSIEHFFHKSGGIIPNPLIFDETYLKDEGGKKKQKGGKVRNKFLINFYVNTNKFSFEKLLGVKLTDSNVDKIKRAVNQ